MQEGKAFFCSYFFAVIAAAPIMAQPEQIPT
jgi:hypothetical protein